MRTLKALNLIAGLLLLAPVAQAEDPAALADRSLYQAVDVAREMMNSQDIYDRILAAGALSDVGDTQALALLERCISIDDIVIRRSAIDTLISGTHPNSVNLLFKVASNDDEVLGLMAESLSSVPRDDMGDLLLEALEQGDFVKKHALQALVRSTGSAESAAVRKLVESTKTSPVIRAYGNYTLLSHGDNSVSTAMLETAAASSNADELEVTAVALGLVDSKESRAALGIGSALDLGGVRERLRRERQRAPVAEVHRAHEHTLAIEGQPRFEDVGVHADQRQLPALTVRAREARQQPARIGRERCARVDFDGDHDLAALAPRRREVLARRFIAREPQSIIWR